MFAQAAVPVEAEAEELAHVREDAVHDVREAPPVNLRPPGGTHM